MYQFYSEGFFGYGDPGDFRYFTLPHVLPILLLIAAIVLVYRFRERLREWKWEGRFRYVLAFVMLLAEMSYFWRLLYVGDETGMHSLMIKLPLQICQWGLICAVFMVMSRNDVLFSINYYCTLIFSTVALLMPTVIMRTGPGYYRYYQFWLEHELPIFATFYMMYVHGKRPQYRHIWTTLGLLAVLAAFCAVANARIPGANFMYLAGNPENGVAGDNLSSLLPRSQPIRAAVYAAAAVVLFHLDYLLWKKLHRENRT